MKALRAPLDDTWGALLAGSGWVWLSALSKMQHWRLDNWWDTRLNGQMPFEVFAKLQPLSDGAFTAGMFAAALLLAFAPRLPTLRAHVVTLIGLLVSVAIGAIPLWPAKVGGIVLSGAATGVASVSYLMLLGQWLRNRPKHAAGGLLLGHVVGQFLSSRADGWPRGPGEVWVGFGTVVVVALFAVVSTRLAWASDVDVQPEPAPPTAQTRLALAAGLLFGAILLLHPLWRAPWTVVTAAGLGDGFYSLVAVLDVVGVVLALVLFFVGRLRCRTLLSVSLALLAGGLLWHHLPPPTSTTSNTVMLISLEVNRRVLVATFTVGVTGVFLMAARAELLWAIVLLQSLPTSVMDRLTFSLPFVWTAVPVVVLLVAVALLLRHAWASADDARSAHSQSGSPLGARLAPSPSSQTPSRVVGARSFGDAHDR